MLLDGRRQWVEYETLLTDPDDFGEIGDAFDETHNIVVRKINDAPVRFFRQRPLVDFAVAWMEQYRNFTGRAEASKIRRKRVWRRNFCRFCRRTCER